MPRNSRRALIALCLLLLLCLCCSARTVHELKESLRLREEICTRFGVSSNVHSFQYKDTLVSVTVAFSEQPNGDPAVVTQAVEGLVRKRFPHAQKIVVTIPDRRPSSPKWWPGKC